jgi:hypothetical protein
MSYVICHMSYVIHRITHHTYTSLPTSHHHTHTPHITPPPHTHTPHPHTQTPEKWDSLTRCWKDHVYLLGAVDLLLIDEVHLLGDERGSTLETLVVRMQMLSRYYQKRLQDNNPGAEKK